jgi:glycosyltransferase involved in cell wall biosynthesis
MKVSICIPTWEQYGNGTVFLSHLLDTIKSQTYKNFNVIISDHSKDDNIENLINEYKNSLDIKYLKFNLKHGNSPANTNNCVLNADGDIIKIMFQDDFFYDDSAIEKIVNSFEDESVSWVVNGCNHTVDGINFTNFMVPAWSGLIVYGQNTISSPSVLSFRKNSECLFDENLIMYMDCEIYFQFFKKFGLPKVIENTLITNRMHPNQISSRYTGNPYEELYYISKKHNL